MLCCVSSVGKQLVSASKRGDYPKVRHIVYENVNDTSAEWDFYLNFACISAFKNYVNDTKTTRDIVKFLIDNGASENGGNFGYTPEQLSNQYGDYELVRYIETIKKLRGK